MKGHQHRAGLRIGENRRLCPFSVFCGSNLKKNTDNAINRNLLVTPVPHLTDLMKN